LTVREDREFLGGSIEMWRLLAGLNALVDSVAGFSGRRVLTRRQREEVYASTRRKDELVEGVRHAGGFRRRVIHEIGDRVSSDGVAWDEETLAFVDDDAVENEVVHREARRCNCGCLLGYGNNIVGLCQACAVTLCKECVRRCERCGVVVCARHTVRTGEHTFCVHHRLHAWWLLFWGCL